MPSFEYVGKKDGKVAQGIVSASNRAGAISQLKSQKIVITKVTQKKMVLMAELIQRLKLLWVCKYSQIN